MSSELRRRQPTKFQTLMDACLPDCDATKNQIHNVSPEKKNAVRSLLEVDAISRIGHPPNEKKKNCDGMETGASSHLGETSGEHKY